MTFDELTQTLDLPEERAERTLELEEKRQAGEITPSEFIELAANYLVRMEMSENPKVSRPCSKTFYSLEHLRVDEDTQPPSINDLLRAQFGEDFSSEEITEIYEQAQEDGPVFLSRNIFLFHEADIVRTEDGFEIEMETFSEEEEETDDDSAEPVDVDTAFSG